MNVDLSGRVALVTGAGGGLGRAHALLLARHGARIVVNDVGGGRDSSASAAQLVVTEIEAMGGEAIASTASVTDYAEVTDMVAAAEARWGGVDILVSNAGILRDKTFAKMEIEDFRAVLEVHLMGAVHTAKAVWAGMAARQYGRIILTSSSSGLYGNFGQSNYAAAKMGLVGLMKTLALEGQRHNIHVNCLAPSAATRMTGDILSDDMIERLTPQSVSPSVVALSAEGAPNGAILCAGGGSFERAFVTLTRGIVVEPTEAAAGEILRQMAKLSDRAEEMLPASGPEQARWEADRVVQFAATVIQ
jgi:NAD(P)-dependent dehydrogenase (short-subunit alcohol dehydrogenase family)